MSARVHLLLAMTLLGCTAPAQVTRPPATPEQAPASTRALREGPATGGPFDFSSRSIRPDAGNDPPEFMNLVPAPIQ